MTQEEANKIAKVISTADGGCSTCVENLCKELNSSELGFVFKYEQPDYTDDEDIVSVTAIKEIIP